jgi:acetyl-CoA acetyltransferase
MAPAIEVPYGAYWSTPFARWQGAFRALHSLRFAAHVARSELAVRGLDTKRFDYGVLGMTRPELGSFYGLPWLMGLAGAGHVAGPTVSQACATSVRAMLAAVQEIGSGLAGCALAIACDRTSNGPHLYHPNPDRPGGTGESEDWVMQNMACDPLGGHAMIRTAENVAQKYSVGTEEQHALVLRREEQYRAALADSCAFQKRFMTLPFPVPDMRFRRTVAELGSDEGVHTSTPEGLAKLKPVVDGGMVTYGAQTYPADGNAAMIVAREELALELSRDPGVRIELSGFGLARAALAYMPEAPIDAAARALHAAGATIGNLDAIKTHNPFAVNDIVFARATGANLQTMNNYGCSLVYGHPNGPTGLRAVIELIEELAMRGGGTGLFTGCAAGDTAMAVVVRVGDRARR